MDRTAARAHRVDHRHAAGRDIVAVAHAAGVAPAYVLAEIGAAAADEFKQPQSLGVHRLGRTAESAMNPDRDIMGRRDRGNRVVDHGLRPRLVGRRHRPQVHAQHGMIGNDIVRRAAVDPGRIDLEPRILRRREPQREIGGGEQRVAALLRVAAGMGGAAFDTDREIAAARTRTGQRAVGKRRGLIGQRRLLAARRLGDQRRRAGRADLLVAVDDDLVAELRDADRLDCRKRREHDRKPALHVRHTGAAEDALVAPEDGLERVIGSEDGVHMTGEKQLDRRLGADLQMEISAMRHRRERSIRRHRLDRGGIAQREIAGKDAEGVGKALRDRGQTRKVARAAVDRRPLRHLVEHRRVASPRDDFLFDPRQHPRSLAANRRGRNPRARSRRPG